MFENNLSIVFGQFGSWKTYEMVKLAYKRYIEDGAIIISNMWLAFPHIRIYENADLLPILDEISVYHKNIITPFNAPPSYLMAHGIDPSDIPNRPIFILIDEGVIFFESRNFASNFKEPKLRNMFATPRHFDMQIVVIVQNYDRLDKLIRDLAQEVVEVTPWFFWIFRVKLSYDTNHIISENGWIREDIPILKKKFSMPYFSYKKDMSKFFWGLYYTKEALGQLAPKNPNEIRSFDQYLQLSPEDLEDWRKNYQKKIAEDFFALPEKLRKKWLKGYEK